MTQTHKDALARGREEGRIVREYLEALERHKPRRGRKRTRDTISAQLTKVEEQLAKEPNPLSRVQLIQERMDLQAELETVDTVSDIAHLESSFIEVALSYSARKGISYAAWRQVGVEPTVLRKAGLTRLS